MTSAKSPLALFAKEGNLVVIAQNALIIRSYPPPSLAKRGRGRFDSSNNYALNDMTPIVVNISRQGRNPIYKNKQI